VNDRLLLDTHIAVWLDRGSPRLTPATRRLIDDCWRSRGTIYLSAVSVWEIAALVDGGRMDLGCSVIAWAEEFLSRPGIEGVPLTLRAAAHAYPLGHLEHRDPADRLLIATAIELGCPLVTYDERVRRFGERHGRQQGFSVVA
jgi:PIN domain nuclease of toxin-antitoxin system